MKTKLIVAITLSLFAGIFFVPTAQSFCWPWDCYYPSPQWGPAPSQLEDDSCEGRGGISSMVEVRNFSRGGLVVIVYKVTCADGYSYEVEEETGGEIINYEPPSETEYVNCWEEEHMYQEYCN